MKHLFLSALLLTQLLCAYAQGDASIHEGTFRKGRFGMSSNPYKPDPWEKPYFEGSLRTVFPSDLVKHPDQYPDQLLQLVGIVDSVYSDSSGSVAFVLDNKYWDYIEDYSVQDEKIFLSEKGDGRFMVTLSGLSAAALEALQRFPAQKKLFLVYGKFTKLEHGLPVLAATQIKFFAYELYTTKVFSYELERDASGQIVTDKKGKPQLKNFDLLKVAGPGQNK